MPDEVGERSWEKGMVMSGWDPRALLSTEGYL